LLGLGRQAGRGAAPLHVDDDERQLEGHREADRLRLQRDAGPGRGGDPEVPAERGAEGRADAGDLVLGLEGAYAEALVLAQLVEDVRRRGDRVGAEEQRQLGAPGGGDEPVGEREVAGDVAVGAARHRGGLDLVGHRERLGCLAEVPPGPQRGQVGVAHLGLAGELLLEEAHGALDVAAVHPRQEPEGEHVLGAPGLLAAEAEVLDRLDGHAGEVEGVHVEGVERAVLERVRGVAHALEVALGEVGRVSDHGGAAGQLADVRLERGRVHRHEHVGRVAGRHDVVVGEVQLERRDTGQGAGRSADLGGEVRQRRLVVAERGRLRGEPVTSELHTVTGVAGEADDDPVSLKHRLGHAVAPPVAARSILRL
jgi:hypothetical protein